MAQINKGRQPSDSLFKTGLVAILRLLDSACLQVLNHSLLSSDIDSCLQISILYKIINYFLCALRQYNLYCVLLGVMREIINNRGIIIHNRKKSLFVSQEHNEQKLSYIKLQYPNKLLQRKLEACYQL